MINVDRDAVGLLTNEKRTEYMAQALGHGQALPASGVGGRVVALKDAVDGQVTRTKVGIQEDD